MSLRLLDPGLLSLLVDAGRPRWRSLGVPLGGAADRAALAIGNALVGNSANTLALEFTLAGPTVQADRAVACVVFGAPFTVAINGKRTGAVTRPSRSLPAIACTSAARKPVHAGVCASRVGSMRRNRWAVDRVLNRCKPAKRWLAVRAAASPRGLAFASLWEPFVSGRDSQDVRVLDGPQRDCFADDSFFTQSYEVAADSNRMGLRLIGEPLVRRSGELVSEAVAPGAIQITNDGLPVAIGVDGQTIGGYPKIAHVIRADLDRLAQLRPGNRVRFARVSWDQAEQAATDRTALLRIWLARIRAADREPIRD